MAAIHHTLLFVFFEILASARNTILIVNVRFAVCLICEIHKFLAILFRIKKFSFLMSLTRPIRLAMFQLAGTIGLLPQIVHKYLLFFAHERILVFGGKRIFARV